MDSDILVSVAVITYNSSKYVIETLESIKNQTYKNIELIISDDCSTDNTVDVCKEWLKKNNQRFVSSIVIVPEKNTGIPANINRAVKKSSGVWFKSIAGDDILINNAIEKYVSYVKDNEEVQIVFAKEYEFYENKGQVVEEPFEEVDDASLIIFNNSSAREQYLFLLNDELKCCVLAPTSFAKRDLFVKFPYNENYKGFEDIPEWIKLTKNGIHLNCMDSYTLKYRRGDSLTFSKQRLFSPVFWDSKHRYFWDELRDMLLEESLYEVCNRKKKELLKVDMLDCFTNNKSSFFNKILCLLFSKIIERFGFSKRD